MVVRNDAACSSCLLLASRSSAPISASTTALRHPNRDLRHGRAQYRLLLGYTGLITFGQPLCSASAPMPPGIVDGLWPDQRFRRVAARRAHLDAVRAGDRVALAAHPRFSSSWYARLRADGLLLRQSLRNWAATTASPCPAATIWAHSLADHTTSITSCSFSLCWHVCRAASSNQNSAW